MTDVSVILLTHNEEKHIARCLESLHRFTDKIFIVDSFSTDNTVDIARGMGAIVVQNPWLNYATQYNYGIANTPFRTTWLMRMDADEYVLPELANEINERLPTLPANVSGIYVKRRVLFFDRWIRHGGYYPIWLLRLWRRGQGVCEQIWMDEHIKLDDMGNQPAQTIQFQHDLVDHNLNNLTWWTQKHNNYAVREAIDLLNIKYNFDETQRVEPKLFGSQEARTRFLKIQYASLPLFTRPILYFLYRYFIRFGFLDGRRGLIWHFLQGLWYRFLVDAKLFEVYFHAGRDKQAIIDFFRTEYGNELRPARPNEPVGPDKSPVGPPIHTGQPTDQFLSGQTDLARFNNDWYNPGPRWKIVAWFLTNALFLNNYLPIPVALKVAVLRLFGATLGTGVVIKPAVNIKYPWLLRVGNHVWIGEQVWIDNLSEVIIGNHVCLSQGAMLLTGNHDYSRPTFDLTTRPITLEDGVWIGAKAVVCPGVRCQSHAVLAVNSVATQTLGAYGIYQGNPAVWVRKRTIIA